MIGVKRLMIASALVAATAAPALALEGNSYSPAFCDATFSGAAYNNPTIAKAPWYFHNGTNGLLYASCPVVKTSEDSQTGIKYAVVHVSNGGGTLPCHLYSNDVYGGVVSWQTSSTSATGNQALSFNPPQSSVIWGNYGIMCELPVGSSIRSYIIFEN